MKVLHLLNTKHFSGAENVACQIIGMFRERSDMKMVYVSLDGPIRDALKERNIEFRPISEMSVKEIRRIISEEKPDIIHAHDMRAGFFSALACGSIPLISHIHNNAFDSRGISWKSIAYMYAAKKAQHIFWVSQSSFDGYAFHSFFKKKSSILYNIVDIDALYEKKNLDRKNYDYDIIYIGRLTYQKNPERLMAVFKLLKEKLPNVKIAIVGIGELEEKTKALAKEYHLQDTVDFLGFQENPLKLLYDSKVMVMTSRWEGTPMCALEAMAFGVPIVSTPVDGLKDLIVSGENGYLSDDNNELVSKIAELLSNENLRDAYTRNTIKKAKIFNDVENYKYNVSKIYANCLMRKEM